MMSKGRKITILGMGRTGMRKADAIEQFCTGEVWSLNNAYLTYPQMAGKWARFFELHSNDYLATWQPAPNMQPINHAECLHRLGCPVYTSQRIPIVTRQQIVGEMAEPRIDFAGGEPNGMLGHERVFGSFGRARFFGSPSVMLALALWEHDNGQEIDEIRSWGIDTQDPDHQQQRASWAWWLSKADERGIKITGSALDFFGEHENDAGLVGLSQLVNESLEQKEKRAADDGAQEE